MTTGDQSPVPDFISRLRLDGKSYVVAGAGVGMGRMTSHALAQAGAAHIITVDVDPERAAEIAAEVGPIATPWSGDLTSRADVEALAEFAETTMGKIDGFVDIIGMARWQSILDMDDDNFDWSLSINLRHAYLLSQQLGLRMKETGGGTMTFIASVSGLTGAPMHAGYGAAKAGLMAWIKTLAVELGPFNIRANAVAPGTILSPRMDAIFTQQQRDTNAANTPLARMGGTYDIASAALFLTSPLADYITGHTIVVDGGVGAKFPYPTL